MFTNINIELKICLCNAHDRTAVVNSPTANIQHCQMINKKKLVKEFEILRTRAKFSKLFLDKYGKTAFFKIK